MRVLLIIAVILGTLAGCARLNDRFFDRNTPDFDTIALPSERSARPTFVVLETEVVIVVMEDDAQCIGPSRGQGSVRGGWTGTLQECPYAYTYSVEIAAGAPSGSIVLNEVIPDPLPVNDGQPTFRPLAAVLITDTFGRSYRYETAEGF